MSASRSLLQRPSVVGVLVIVMAVLVVWLPSFGRKAVPEPAADAVGYLTIAYHIAHHGVLPDPGAPLETVPPAGNMMAPLYPGLLAGVMLSDAAFDQHASCFLQQFYAPQGQSLNEFPACAGLSDQAIHSPRFWGGVLWMPRVFLALGLALVWLSARRLGLSRSGASIAFVLAAASGAYGEYGQQFLTETMTLPLGTAILLSMAEVVRWVRAKASLPVVLGWALLCGALCGVTALVRPTFTYVLYLAVLGAVVAMALCAVRARWRSHALLWGVVAGALVLSYAVVIAPWVLRNQALFGLWSVTGNYGGYILAQRVAYNAMSLQEWLASFLFWLPDFGDSAARAFFAPEVLEKLDWFSPQSYYVLGNGAWMQDMLAQVGGNKDALQGWLLRFKVLPELGTHVAVTLPLALRGLWVSKYFGLIGVLFWLPSLVSACRSWRCSGRAEWLVFCAPAIFLLGLQAFVSVSIPRYNLLVIPCMAIAAAPVLMAWGQAVWALKKRTGVRWPDRL